MKAELKKESVNQILKDTNIYEEGDLIESVALVVKGRVEITSKGTKLVAGTGSFLGISDLERGVYGMTYTAQTNCVIYVFSASGSNQDIQRILQMNKDYGALMVANMSKLLSTAAANYIAMQKAAEEGYIFTAKTYERYKNIAQEYGVNVGEIRSLENVRPIDLDSELSIEKISYYQACSKVSLDVQKAFYGASPVICMYHVKEEIELLQELRTDCLSYAEYLEELLNPIITDSQSLYTMMVKLAATMQRMGEDTGKVLTELDQIIDYINLLETLLVDKASVQIEIDRNQMEETYFSLLNSTGDRGTSAAVTADADLALVEEFMFDISELDHSMENILHFGGIDEETSHKFVDMIEQFMKLPDKESTEDNVRNLRRSILKEYYKIYKQVFLKDFHSSDDTPLEVDLFLRYGFLSERLLKEELIEELLSADHTGGEYGDCGVYDMKEWLTAIYKGEKEPSKNEFDMDYDEFLRDQKKNKVITEQQQQEMSADKALKLDFEISNMFRVNHRLVNGQITTFVPFLYTEGCGASLSRNFLSKDKINAGINKILRIDYSAFYRESLYTREVEGIKKEFIQQEVHPDIIIMPTNGSRGIMWQELSGRRRTSPGRFLLPAFMEGDLEKTLIRLVGGFRWELCRTIQGAYWNNIQVKSLTSEYSDFLQFYRKNKDLSDEKKEKLKLQIQKNRNNTREIFATDYENWIRHEAKGGIVLSKPVREILATYCPFAADIRKGIESQPIFQEAMARFNRERAKKLKEYELKYKVWEKNHVKVPEEVTATRDFYRDM